MIIMCLHDPATAAEARCCLRPGPDILGSAAVSGGVACTLHTELSPDIPSKQRESGSIIRHQTVVSLSDITLSRGQIREQRQNTGQSAEIKSASEYSQLCKCEIQMIVLCLCQLTTDVTPPDADEMQ